MSYCKNFLILLTFGALAFGSVQEPSPDEERITELFVKVIQAWGQRPTSFITSRFADDIYLVDPQRRTLKGVEQIRQAYTDLLHRGLLQGSQLTVDLETFVSRRRARPPWTAPGGRVALCARENGLASQPGNAWTVRLTPPRSR